MYRLLLLTLDPFIYIFYCIASVAYLIMSSYYSSLFNTFFFILLICFDCSLYYFNHSFLYVLKLLCNVIAVIVIL